MDKTNVIGQLASSLGRRDEVPNQELAKKIVAKKDNAAIRDLVELLSNKKKGIQNDCIKVLYEVGAVDPSLISPYTKEFLTLLEHKNNRLQWVAMAALDAIAARDPKSIYPSLTKIIASAEKGSVITRDHAVNILISLCAVKEYTDKAFTLLSEQLLKAPNNQLPMYAERAMPVVNDKNRPKFIRILNDRLPEFEKESQRKRVEKVIKRIGGR